jgi:hypothetical protein
VVKNVSILNGQVLILKKVVDKQLASVAECKLHEIAADHASIGFLDHPTYKIVSKVIRSAIDSSMYPRIF